MDIDDEPPQISEEDLKKLYRFREKHGRKVVIACTVSLILIVIFLGFAYGAARVCDQVGGYLDDKFSCHLGYDPAGPGYQVVDPTGGGGLIDWGVENYTGVD